MWQKSTSYHSNITIISNSSWSYSIVFLYQRHFFLRVNFVFPFLFLSYTHTMQWLPFSLIYVKQKNCIKTPWFFQRETHPPIYFLLFHPSIVYSHNGFWCIRWKKVPTPTESNKKKEVYLVFAMLCVSHKSTDADSCQCFEKIGFFSLVVVAFAVFA